MIKVLGELIALVIKGEDCLKEGQHLNEMKIQVEACDIQFPLLTFGFINVKDQPHYCYHASKVRHSPVPHTQTSFSLGSPAVCTHSPVTPPESASSCFPPGSLPKEAHHSDYSDRQMHGSTEKHNDLGDTVQFWEARGFSLYVFKVSYCRRQQVGEFDHSLLRCFYCAALK